jgi:serine phosphatase RsbU (regulator of sigma subunit)
MEPTNFSGLIAGQLISFIVAGIGLCLASGAALLAFYGGRKSVYALAGAVLASACLPFPALIGGSGFASWLHGTLVVLAAGLTALYEYLRMRGDSQGSGVPQALAIASASLAGFWILFSAILDGEARHYALPFVTTLVAGLLVAAILLLRRKRRRIEEPDARISTALVLMIAGAVFLLLATFGLIGPTLAGVAYPIIAIVTPSLLAATEIGGKGSSAAVTNNRTLRLTAKSLEEENRQLSDMAARLEYERNRLQQKRVELEKENKQAEDRIKELCVTADAFFTLGQSIDYARRIQQALVPSETKLRATTGDAFILNLPRDKVSGDFLWCQKFDDGWTMLCVADCTGHGVPGAFMSALGTMLLGQIVTERTIRRPDQVLAAMDRNLRGALSSNGGDIPDGMEAGIVLLSPTRTQAIYCGARIGLHRVRNGKCEVVDGVRRQIGGRLKPNAPNFESVTIPLHKDEMLYLASDGYQDQLGGPDSRRYLSRRFNDTLAWIGALPVSEQRNALLTSHNQWKAGRDQTDDIMVVGLRV